VTGTRRNVSAISGYLGGHPGGPGRRRARHRWLPGHGPVALREAWRTESAGSGWSRPDDWWAPEVDALAEAVASTGPVGAAEAAGWLPACDRLGRARADAGVGLGETLDDLCALWRLLPAGAPPLPVVRAVAEAWADAGLRHLATSTCEDPLTGLASPAYLRTRLAEVYREAERGGVPVPDSHALLVVAAEPPDADPDDPDATGASGWRMLRHRLAVGVCLRSALSGGETLASLSATSAVGLVGRGPQLPPMLAGLRHGLTAHAALRPVRIWLERLPTRLDEAYTLLSDLAR
jgi:hypothetical protein